MRPFKLVLWAAVIAAVVAVLIWGPRTRGEEHPPPADFVVVDYWEHWAGAEADAMQGIVKDFNDTVGAQKKIYVRFLSQSNINQKVMLAAAAGVPPDIAGLWDQPLPQWAALDALEPLDELAKSHGITADLYKPIYWKGCHYQGHLVALLSTPNDVALLWNKKLFAEHAAELEKAGLDPTRPPRTLQELDRYAAALDQWTIAPITGKRQLESAGYLPTEPGWYMAQTPIWFGATLYDERTGKFTLDSVETLAAFRWIAAYSKRITTPVLNNFHSGLGPYASASNPFLTGQLMMELQGPWVATVIEQYKPSMNHGGVSIEGSPPAQSPAARAANAQWAAAPFPSLASAVAISDADRIDNAVTWCGFDALVIPRGAKHKNEAFEFIAYVQRQEVMEKLCALHCKGTPLREHSDTWYQTHPNRYAEIFDRIASSPNARTVPPVPIWPEAVDEINAAIMRVAALEEAPEAACAELQDSLQTKLEQFRARHPR